MSSKAQSGVGAIFSVCATSSGTFLPVGDITSAPYKAGELGTVSTTNLQSVTEEIAPVLQKLGTIPLKGNRVSTDPGQTLLYANFQATPKAPIFWKLQLPVNLAGGQTTTGDLLSGSAWVIGYQIEDVDPTKIITFTANLTVIGTATLVEGS
jgi:hypothetical protein